MSKRSGSETSTGQHNCKIVLIGSSDVGKSCILAQFLDKTFIEEYTPSVEDIRVTVVEHKEEKWKLEIVDPSGQEEYRGLRAQYMNDTDGYLLIYSVFDESSFQDIREFTDTLLKVKGVTSFPMVLLANKVDIDSERVVTKQMGQKFAFSRGIRYVEASAKEPDGVLEAFDLILDNIHRMREMRRNRRTYTVRSLSTPEESPEVTEKYTKQTRELKESVLIPLHVQQPKKNIRRPRPISVSMSTFGSEEKSDKKLERKQCSIQ